MTDFDILAWALNLAGSIAIGFILACLALAIR